MSYRARNSPENFWVWTRNQPKETHSSQQEAVKQKRGLDFGLWVGNKKTTGFWNGCICHGKLGIQCVWGGRLPLCFPHIEHRPLGRVAQMDPLKGFRYYYRESPRETKTPWMTCYWPADWKNRAQSSLSDLGQYVCVCGQGGGGMSLSELPFSELEPMEGSI